MMAWGNSDWVRVLRACAAKQIVDLDHKDCSEIADCLESMDYIRDLDGWLGWVDDHSFNQDGVYFINADWVKAAIKEEFKARGKL